MHAQRCFFSFLFSCPLSTANGRFTFPNASLQRPCKCITRHSHFTRLSAPPAGRPPTQKHKSDTTTTSKNEARMTVVWRGQYSSWGHHWMSTLLKVLEWVAAPEHGVRSLCDRVGVRVEVRRIACARHTARARDKHGDKYDERNNGRRVGTVSILQHGASTSRRLHQGAGVPWCNGCGESS